MEIDIHDKIHISIHLAKSANDAANDDGAKAGKPLRNVQQGFLDPSAAFICLPLSSPCRSFALLTPAKSH
jgi:hypothetical protein